MTSIPHLFSLQREYFLSGATKDIEFRIELIRKMKKSILVHERDILRALYDDLGKSEYEAYMCEMGLVLRTISYTIKHIKQWTRPKNKWTPLLNFPARSTIVEEPYGNILIIAPWNYPLLLSLEPLIGAIAAGNCAILQLSDYSTNTNNIISNVIHEVFEEQHVATTIPNDIEKRILLEQPFDYIFFTGSPNVGKIVLEKTAPRLIPTTLELGGKSPAIIEKSANLTLAAKRITFGKYLNCGQTCIAPDYIIIEEAIHDRFVNTLIQEIHTMFPNALRNPHYGKIINRKHFDRLLRLIDNQKVVCGGHFSTQDLKIEPTVMDHVTFTDPVMREEIFGPLLPVITVKDINEAVNRLQRLEKPLALYLFTNNKKTEDEVLNTLSFGGGCVNDTISHIVPSNLPFGGIGNSGMGHYHGQYTFQTFSHQKTIVRKATFPDIPMRYPPFSTIKKKLLRFFLN